MTSIKLKKIMKGWVYSSLYRKKRHTNRNYYNPRRTITIFHFFSLHFCPFASDFLSVFEQRHPEQLIASLPIWPRLFFQLPHSTSLSQYHVTRFGGYSLALINSSIKTEFISKRPTSCKFPTKEIILINARIESSGGAMVARCLATPWSRGHADIISSLVAT